MNRLTIIITAPEQADANVWMRENIDPSGDSFTCPLTSDGVSVTHYWCSGVWDDEQAAALGARFTVHTGPPDGALGGLVRFQE